MLLREPLVPIQGGAIALSQAFLLGPLSLVFLDRIQDWYVDVNAPNCGTGMGTQADPFCDVMDAVAAAADGDTIHIAPGTYFENVVLDKDLELIGTGGDQVTILDGNAAGRVVLVSNSAVSLTGVTLTNGDTGGANGGGLLMDGTSSVVLANSAVSGNSAISCQRFYCFGSGGGICSLGGSLTIVDSTVTDNHAGSGSGISCGGGTLTLVDSTVSNPGVNVEGTSGAMLTLTNTSITGDACYGTTFGVRVFQADLALTNSSVTNVCNAIDAYESNVEIVNATISGNDLQQAVFGIASAMSIANSILSGDDQNQLEFKGSSSVTVQYSLVQGGWPGVGNIDADPLFADPLNGNFRLMPGSPCIDAGNNLAVPMGIWTDLDGKLRFIDDPLTPDTGHPGHLWPIVDMGAYEFGIDPPRKVRRR